MREIKFRAWSPDYQGMFYTHEQGETEEVFWQFGLNGKITVSTLEIIDRLTGGYHDQSEGYVEHGNAIVMQYTGLNDKNGKEIYEGDIITHPHGFKGKACWLNGCFKVKWGDGFIDSLSTVCFFCEVIGNIYESPELLKQGVDTNVST